MKINIGRYLPGDSIIHRIDARLKLFANIAFIVLFFLVNTFMLEAIMITPLLIAFTIATKKPTQLLRMMKFPLWVGIFLFIINGFVLETPSIQVDVPKVINWDNWKDVNWVNIYGIFKINYITLMSTLSITFRIYSIILTVTLLTLTTPPALLIKALDWYFTPLRLMKIPVNILTMIISISLRFVPTLVDEAQRVLKSQASRGTDFRNGNLKTKIKATIVLIIPLFVSSFTKAEDLANAMETRGYDPYSRRTSYHKWRIWWLDILSAIVVVGMVVIFSIVISNHVFDLPTWWENTKCIF